MNAIADCIQFTYVSAAAYTAYIYVSAVLLPLVQKVTEIFLQYSAMIKSSSLWISGLKDAWINGLMEREIKVNEQVYTPRKLAKKLQNSQAYLFRGAFLYSAALFTTASVIYRAQHSELHAGYYITKNLGSLFFIFANAVTLHQSVQQHREGQQLKNHSPIYSEVTRGKIEMGSAKLRILNSVGNIWTSSMTLLDFSSALTVTIGGLSFATGLVNFIYDYRSKPR